MKRIGYLIITILSMCFIGNVKAASGSVTAYTPVSTATVGSTFTVTVTVSCSEALGSWQYGLTYDSSYISLESSESSSTTIADYGNGSDTVRYYTYKFRAIAPGTAWVNITGASMVAYWDDSLTMFTPSVSGDYVVVKTQAEIEASYSSDNNLSSLAVEGYDLSPAFNMNTTEYKVEVPEDVTSVEVSAVLNDWTARVFGVGTIDVSSGSNKIEVVVTAQNGATKTYTINLTVKDINPINVTIDGKKYSVVKMAKLLENPTGFTPDTIKINNIEVPSFKSKTLNMILVGLKDETGKIGLYIYDENKKTYTKYSELKSSSLTLFPVDTSDSPVGFTKSKTVINDIEYTSFINDLDKDYVLIYAKNIEDGKEDFYVYDKDTGTFIKYDDKILTVLVNNDEENKIYLIAISSLAVIFFLISIVEAHKSKKMKKAIKKMLESASISQEIPEKEDNVETSLTTEEIKPSEEIIESTEDIVVDEDNDFSELQPKSKKKKKKKH